MKSIELSDEMYQKLIDIATEMTTQNHRGTRMPYFFQIRDWVKVYDADLNGDTHIYLNRDYNIQIETVDELISYLEDNSISFEEEKIREMWSDDFFTELPDWIEENAEGLERHSYSLQPVYKNSFLTAKAAQQHLEANYYHYHPKADVYLSHAWRNPEMKIISTFLWNLVGKEIHQ